MYLNLVSGFLTLVRIATCFIMVVYVTLCYAKMWLFYLWEEYVC